MSNKEKLVKLLIKKKLTIASVESLTGGLFTATLASVPGVSRVLRGGLVTYQASLKASLLNIRKSYINEHGVVSKQVATSMAKRGHKLLNADIVISFTGNAGPTREPGGAEVGRVYSTIVFENKIYNFTNVFQGDRNKIRKDVVSDGINNILKILVSK